jgi:hypothetical protein
MSNRHSARTPLPLTKNDYDPNELDETVLPHPTPFLEALAPPVPRLGRPQLQASVTSEIQRWLMHAQWSADESQQVTVLERAKAELDLAIASLLQLAPRQPQ